MSWNILRGSFVYIDNWKSRTFTVIKERTINIFCNLFILFVSVKLYLNACNLKSYPTSQLRSLSRNLCRDGFVAIKVIQATIKQVSAKEFQSRHEFSSMLSKTNFNCGLTLLYYILSCKDGNKITQEGRDRLQLILIDSALHYRRNYILHF